MALMRCPTGGQSTLEGAELPSSNSLSLGFTLGYHINESLQLTTAYTASVNDKQPTDLSQDAFILSLVYGWHPLIEGAERLLSGG